MVFGLDRRWGQGLGLNITFKELIKNRLGYRLVLFGDVAEHVRVDVQADIAQVVEVLACDKPDDLADLAL